MKEDVFKWLHEAEDRDEGMPHKYNLKEHQIEPYSTHMPSFFMIDGFCYIIKIPFPESIQRV